MKAVLSALFSLVIAGCAHTVNIPEQKTSIPETKWTAERDVVFTPSDWPEPLRADVFLPESPGPHPAVLMVHGGGWNSFSRGGMETFADMLATHGFAVMNIDYRLAPDFHFPAQLHDLQQAMHWLHENAERLDIDVDRIGAFGYSAGAHLVSLLALVASEPDSELNSPYGGPETRLSAIVTGGTPSDLRKFGSEDPVRQFLGVTMEQEPSRYALASPVTHISENAPPFFIFHGAWDAQVPKHHATDFQTALAERGVQTEMYLLKFRGHALTFLINSGAMSAALQFLERTLGRKDQNLN